MPAFKNLVGQRFGRLTVEKFLGFNYQHRSKYLCRCNCGTTCEVFGSALTTDNSSSCGCARKENCGRKKVHGLCGSPEYTAWEGLKYRCSNPFDPDYGGRGIQVCSWISKSVLSILLLIGPRPSSKHSIDRIDNDRHYSCGICSECKRNGWIKNIRWATKSQQMLNRRSWSKAA